MRDHSRSSITSGSSTARRRKAWGSVRRVPQHQSVAAIVLGAGDTEAVTKAVKLLGIDGEHRKASLQQHFDHRSARRLDGHRDLARLRSGPLQDAVAQSRQGSGIMADIALGHLLALAIEQTDAMLFMRPVEADKPKELVIHPIRLHSAVGHRDACQSLYWRSRRKPPTGHPSRPLCRGTSPTQVLVARVGIGGSQQIGPPPVYQDRLRTSERVQGGPRRIAVPQLAVTSHAPLPTLSHLARLTAWAKSRRAGATCR